MNIATSLQVMPLFMALVLLVSCTPNTEDEELKEGCNEEGLGSIPDGAVLIPDEIRKQRVEKELEYLKDLKRERDAVAKSQNSGKNRVGGKQAGASCDELCMIDKAILVQEAIVEKTRSSCFEL